MLNCHVSILEIMAITVESDKATINAKFIGI